VSLKVLPIATATATLRFAMDETTAVRRLNEWAGQPLPLSASAWWNDTLVLRLAGARAAVDAAVATLGGERIEPAAAAGFWHHVRNHSDDFFLKARDAVAAGGALWRLSVPSATPPIRLPGEQLIEWGGAQRWWRTPAGAADVRDAATRTGGHATLFRARDKSAGVFAPLQSPLDRIHRELKKSFDPAGIFNPGRLYPGL
jgi:glycolate oxidase FAD binding subunit